MGFCDRTNFYTSTGVPPVTITGVAPWAQQSSAIPSRTVPIVETQSRVIQVPKEGGEVARAAMSSSGRLPPVGPSPQWPCPVEPSRVGLSHSHLSPQANTVSPAASGMAIATTQLQQLSSHATVAPVDNHSCTDGSQSALASTAASLEAGQQGMELLLAYMEKCTPVEDAASGEYNNATSSWLATQAAPTPTLRPTLRFHDLVFGRELGKGAFR